MTNQIESLKKALYILELFMGTENLGVTDISKLTSYPTSTVHRILNTLEYMGYVYKDEISNKYKLGSKLFYLGNYTDINKNIISKSKPLIESLSKELLQTISMSVLSENQSIVIYKKDSIMKMGMVPKIGEKKSLHCSASGKVLTAFSNKQDICLEEIEFCQLTKNTITYKSDFIEEVNQVKNKGYAIDDEEIERDLYCIAVPVFNIVGDLICSLSISGLKSRMLDNQEIIIRRLLETSQQLTKIL